MAGEVTLVMREAGAADRAGGVGISIARDTPAANGGAMAGGGMGRVKKTPRRADAAARPGRNGRSALKVQSMVGHDWFARVRSDAELARLVGDVAARSPQPYAELWQRLVGQAEPLDERAARARWLAAVEHRRTMGVSLGRPVHLRVAALDLLYRHEPAAHPLVLAPATLEDLLRLATTDPLTGLANREQFLAILGHELRQRSPQRLTVAFADVDGMKAVNDRHGHARGDDLLREVAAALRRHARTGDVVARIGGDEFAALLLGVGEARAAGYAARVQRSLEHGETGARLSVGLVEARKGETPEAILERADQAMYAHKRASRGRHAAAPARAAEPRARPVALYACAFPDRYLALHRALAERGVPLVAAGDPEVAGLLWRLLLPRLVLADVMFPRQGGEAFLAAGPGRRDDPVRALVAPARWTTVQRGRAARPVVEVPPQSLAADRLFDTALGERLPPLPGLETEAEGSRLMEAVAAVAGGREVAAKAQEATARVEYRLVARQLGV
jgi:diguanylate cyclase (GGDEF)-like protein